MEIERIAALLRPFTAEALSAAQLAAFGAYLDLLLRWNQRINLTAVRAPDEVVTRHFGESSFAAGCLLPSGGSAEVADIGSGAGFPGLPLKIIRPGARVTLIEAHGKKATFLKEVIRALRLEEIKVMPARAENVKQQFDLVMLRAVERFGDVLPVATTLVRPGGRIALLIGSSQAGAAQQVLPAFAWSAPIPIPHSSSRIVLEGNRLH
ncbi:MAG: 16S rRNA (guanine(527)-N(7))-methyltransferase RsmG [Acidobacteria bacterium]|nr:16S rRNA (guanine(527)-N(7))-methyltransferase RsmG [Acidobacteriota bacterium]